MSQLAATSTKTLERVYAKAKVEVEHLRDAAEHAATGGARNFAQARTICRGRRCGSNQCKETGRKVGAGEGIRTLDPDLGKVVLYP
jgi:hypothetical protein